MNREKRSRVLTLAVMTSALFVISTFACRMPGAREAYTPHYIGAPIPWYTYLEPSRVAASFGAVPKQRFSFLALFADVVICFALVLFVYFPYRAFQDARVRDPTKCAACGYDLRGSLAQRRCPECGTPFEVHRASEL